MNTITTDIALFNASWTDSCGMLLDEKGGCQRAPKNWGVCPEEERDGRMGREFYLLDSPDTRVFVPMMSEAHKLALDAICDSISHTIVVTLDNDPDVRFELLIQCDDNVESDEVAEYWGTNDEGNSWRVHVRVGA